MLWIHVVFEEGLGDKTQENAVKGITRLKTKESLLKDPLYQAKRSVGFDTTVRALWRNLVFEQDKPEHPDAEWGNWLPNVLQFPTHRHHYGPPDHLLNAFLLFRQRKHPPHSQIQNEVLQQFKRTSESLMIFPSSATHILISLCVPCTHVRCVLYLNPTYN